eukprot:185968-Pyramimonas_sp.AAC.1
MPARAEHSPNRPSERTAQRMPDWAKARPYFTRAAPRTDTAPWGGRSQTAHPADRANNAHASDNAQSPHTGESAPVRAQRRPAQG